MNSIGPLPNLDLRALLQAHQQELFTTFNCHQVGSIVSFDAAKQTATVKIAMQRLVFNQPQGAGEQLQLFPTIVEYPALVDCPVFVNSGGGSVLTMPVEAGDTCLILFNDRDFDTWFSTGSTVQPNTLRTHSLADGLILVGFRNLRNPVLSYSITDAELRNDKLGGQVSLGTKVGIKNNSTSLLTTLNAIISALSALDALKTGGSASGSIAAAQSQVTALLK